MLSAALASQFAAWLETTLIEWILLEDVHDAADLIDAGGGGEFALHDRDLARLAAAGAALLDHVLGQHAADLVPVGADKGVRLVVRGHVHLNDMGALRLGPLQLLHQQRDARVLHDQHIRLVIGPERLLGVGTHRDAGHVHAAVGDRLEGHVLLGHGLAGGRELGDRAERRRLRHLAAGVGVDLGIEHEHVDVAPAREHVVEPPSRCRRPKPSPPTIETLRRTRWSTTLIRSVTGGLVQLARAVASRRSAHRLALGAVGPTRRARCRRMPSTRPGAEHVP